ncbi:MAG: hypothetical protein ABSA46_19325 [Thermodesulfovibrionales bacterium]|jgi:hypothetical protein
MDGLSNTIWRVQFVGQKIETPTFPECLFLLMKKVRWKNSYPGDRGNNVLEPGRIALLQRPFSGSLSERDGIGAADTIQTVQVQSAKGKMEEGG